MKNRDLFNLLSHDVISDAYFDPQHTDGLRDQFGVDGYVKLPNLFREETFKIIKHQVDKIQIESLRKDFLMPGYETPRKLSVVGGGRILDDGFPLAMLYANYDLRSILSRITGRDLYAVTHAEEFIVANFLVSEDDTHGWHLDDPQYALVIITDAPDELNGGNVEYVSNWRGFCDRHKLDNQRDLQRTIEFASRTGYLRMQHHIAGDCYLLNAGDCLHRVTPITGSGMRKVLNMAYDDRRNRLYGETASLLYGQEEHV